MKMQFMTIILNTVCCADPIAFRCGRIQCLQVILKLTKENDYLCFYVQIHIFFSSHWVGMCSDAGQKFMDITCTSSQVDCRREFMSQITGSYHYLPKGFFF